jgi:hypothetical protein
MFAQSVYLIFASVYMCKEAVEHLLLSAGDDQQHHADHHHHSDGYVMCPAKVDTVTELHLALQRAVAHGACVFVPGIRCRQCAVF